MKYLVEKLVLSNRVSLRRVSGNGLGSCGRGRRRAFLDAGNNRLRNGVRVIAFLIFDPGSSVFNLLGVNEVPILQMENELCATTARQSCEQQNERNGSQPPEVISRASSHPVVCPRVPRPARARNFV